MATRPDPYRQFNFRLEIDGMQLASFSEVALGAAITEVVEYREGGDPSTVRKLPGLSKVGDITLKRGITASKELHEWLDSVSHGVANRKNGFIVLLDDARQPVVRWKFINAFPRKWEGPNLDARGNDVAIESLTLCCEGLERE